MIKIGGIPRVSVRWGEPLPAPNHGFDRHETPDPVFWSHQTGPELSQSHRGTIIGSSARDFCARWPLKCRRSGFRRDRLAMGTHLGLTTPYHRGDSRNGTERVPAATNAEHRSIPYGTVFGWTAGLLCFLPGSCVEPTKANHYRAFTPRLSTSHHAIAQRRGWAV